jgi:pyruvate/2-oxoglutarate dehydrogenase complex dihydrolipoamide dehydrogenase (E3) component
LSTSTSSSRSYDVIVIGGGAAGLTAAKLAGETLKGSVIIIEAERMGGDCTWTGCVPSKSLLAAAKATHSARKYGFLAAGEKPDFQKIRKQIAENIQEIYDADDSPDALAKLGVDFLAGSATLLSPSSVEVRQKDSGLINLTAKGGIILCTGASHRHPQAITGLDTVSYQTYETIWSMEKIPDRLTVLGGGPIGCELAQAFSRLGARVTMIAPRLLPKDDPDAQEVLEKVFVAEGITIIKGKAVSVAPEGASSIVTVKKLDGSEAKVGGDQLLVALGRAPRVQGMGLEDIGVALSENGGIAVNEKLRTSVKGIYAAGDCTGDRQL